MDVTAPAIVSTLSTMATTIGGDIQQAIGAILPAMAGAIGTALIATGGVKLVRRFARV